MGIGATRWLKQAAALGTRAVGEDRSSAGVRLTGEEIHNERSSKVSGKAIRIGLDSNRD